MFGKNKDFPNISKFWLLWSWVILALASICPHNAQSMSGNPSRGHSKRPCIPKCVPCPHRSLKNVPDIQIYLFYSKPLNIAAANRTSSSFIPRQPSSGQHRVRRSRPLRPMNLCAPGAKMQGRSKSWSSSRSNREIWPNIGKIRKFLEEHTKFWQHSSQQNVNGDTQSVLFAAQNWEERKWLAIEGGVVAAAHCSCGKMRVEEVNSWQQPPSDHILSADGHGNAEGGNWWLTHIDMHSKGNAAKI